MDQIADDELVEFMKTYFNLNVRNSPIFYKWEMDST